MNGFNPDARLLASIIEKAVGVPVAEVSSDVLFAAADGGQDDGGKWFTTFSYTTSDGHFGDVILFLKRCLWKGRSEAPHYCALAACGVPTPMLYGVVPEETGNDVLCLESLTETGIYPKGKTEWRAFLTLLAQFNACRIAAEYEPHLHPYELVGRVGKQQWITGMDASLTEEALAGYLGSFGGASQSELPTLVDEAKMLFARIAAQPRGLLHQDFLPGNLGWRGDKAEMVVFDLQKNALGPRFADAAPYLYVPNSFNLTSFTEDNGDAELYYESLIAHYLREYKRFGGSDVSVAQFQSEASDLFWAHKIAALPYLSQQADASERAQEIIDFLRYRRESGNEADAIGRVRYGHDGVA